MKVAGHQIDSCLLEKHPLPWTMSFNHIYDSQRVVVNRYDILMASPGVKEEILEYVNSLPKGSFLSLSENETKVELMNFSNFFTTYPLPWSIRSDGRIIDATGTPVDATGCGEVEAIRLVSHLLILGANSMQENANNNKDVSCVEVVKPQTSVYVIKDCNDMYLRNAKQDLWTETPKLARKFRRRCDATRCLQSCNNPIFDAEPVKMDLY